MTIDRRLSEPCIRRQPSLRLPSNPPRPYRERTMLATFSFGNPNVGYQPGECNIGPAEIAARRRSGHLGAVATVLLFLVLVAIDAPPGWRLLLFLPAAGAASGYLQAALHFCANFGLRGVFNFSDRVRNTESVLAVGARARDRRKALQIIGLSVLVGGAVAIVAFLLPA
jgi:hypothetical protein